MWIYGKNSACVIQKDLTVTTTKSKIRMQLTTWNESNGDECYIQIYDHLGAVIPMVGFDTNAYGFHIGNVGYTGLHDWDLTFTKASGTFTINDVITFKFVNIPWATDFPIWFAHIILSEVD